MAKRLRDVCGVPESEPLWRAGRGFFVRDLPDNPKGIESFSPVLCASTTLGSRPNKLINSERVESFPPSV